jgi:hypothetical protein
MPRRNHILTTAALLAVCATPASAATYEDLRSAGAGEVPPPPSSIAAQADDGYQDLRSADAKDAALRGSRASFGPSEPSTTGQDLRPPDAKDAAQHRGLYEVERPYVLDRGFGSPDAADAARDLPPVQIPAPVVEVRDVPSSGFDWGDAGIGAAGMLGLFSIAAGSALILTARKRRQGVQVATH